MGLKKSRSQKSQSCKTSSSKNARLYEALLSIYKFHRLEDLFLLKEQSFLNLCEMAHIGWDLEEKLFKNTILFKKNNTKHTTLSPYWFKCSLKYQNLHYGYLTFISSHKISQTKKNFLKKITYFVASSLYFIKNKKKLESTKHEWEMTFDSFYQSLCITDQNFQILRTNKSFCQLLKISKKECIGFNVFQFFPFPIKEPSKHLKESSWVSHSPQKNLSFKFSIKTIFLKNEKIPFKLILVKDITKEFKMEEMIAQKAKNKDLGMIKGSIAHELNNPIAGIKALLYIINQNLDHKESHIKEIFEDMDVALQRCELIITNLLSVPHKDLEKPTPSNP